jgi:cation transport regulator ChaC
LNTPLNEYVFGYGSLVESAVGVPALLNGWTRRWTVAMDNTVTVAGYKYYLLASGERWPGCVAYLDMSSDPDSNVNGSCLPVDADMLARLDVRERNYERVDVSDAVAPRLGPTWAYVGRPASRRRARSARTNGTLAVARAYVDGVRAGFERLGPDQFETFTRTTDLLDMPVLDLLRVDVPADRAR